MNQISHRRQGSQKQQANKQTQPVPCPGLQNVVRPSWRRSRPIRIDTHAPIQNIPKFLGRQPASLPAAAALLPAAAAAAIVLPLLMAALAGVASPLVLPRGNGCSPGKLVLGAV